MEFERIRLKKRNWHFGHIRLKKEIVAFMTYPPEKRNCGILNISALELTRCFEEQVAEKREQNFQNVFQKLEYIEK